MGREAQKGKNEMKTNKEKIEVMQAFESGEKAEYRSRFSAIWNDITAPDWDWANYDYRVKPSPKLRAWKPEEVPVGALIRRRHLPKIVAVILAVHIDESLGSYCGILSNPNAVSSEFVTDWFTYHGGHSGDRVEHSTDHGKTWLPCGVMEVSK